MPPSQPNNISPNANAPHPSAYTTLPKPKKSKKKPIILGLLTVFLLIVGFFIYAVFTADLGPSPMERVEFENQDGVVVSMLFYPDAEVVDAQDLGLSMVQDREEESESTGDSERKMLIAPLPYEPDVYLTFSFESQAEDWDFEFDSGIFYEIELNQTGETRDLYIYEEPPMALHDFSLNGNKQIGLMTLDVDRNRADDDRYLSRVSSKLTQSLRTEEIIDIVSSIETVEQ